MALLQPYEKEVYGEILFFDTAYHKISQMAVTIEKIDITVEIYRDDNKDVLLDITSHEFLNNDNVGIDLIQIGYELLKKVSEYKGAINVFEEGQPTRNY